LFSQSAVTAHVPEWLDLCVFSIACCIHTHPHHLAQISGRSYIIDGILRYCMLCWHAPDDGVAQPCHVSTRTLTGNLNQWRILFQWLSYSIRLSLLYYLVARQVKKTMRLSLRL